MPALSNSRVANDTNPNTHPSTTSSAGYLGLDSDLARLNTITSQLAMQKATEVPEAQFLGRL